MASSPSNTSTSAPAVPVARMWFRHPDLPPRTLAWSLALMAVTMTAQWPVTFYQSALLGLGRAGVMNAAKAAAVTIAVVGAAIALLYFRTVTAYFAVQAAV